MCWWWSDGECPDSCHQGRDLPTYGEMFPWIEGYILGLVSAPTVYLRYRDYVGLLLRRDFSTMWSEVESRPPLI